MPWPTAKKKKNKTIAISFFFILPSLYTSFYNFTSEGFYYNAFQIKK